MFFVLSRSYSHATTSLHALVILLPRISSRQFLLVISQPYNGSLKYILQPCCTRCTDEIHVIEAPACHDHEAHFLIRRNDTISSSSSLNLTTH
ncbi:hypothetical protein BJ878DRAFT_495781 [Calycina marina]|uniref:Uncharacterized protein n=1 Tax=Calycina marina TaxID=1763456 RepID=A0A9P8CGZ6_9HELO|nr:hypothetical protein BJ878DRAFT_495781 [Calycina marina]